MRLSGAIIVAIGSFAWVGLMHGAPTLSLDEAPRRMSNLQGKKARLGRADMSTSTAAADCPAQLPTARLRSPERISVSQGGVAAKLNRFVPRRRGTALFSASTSPVISARQLAVSGR